MLAALTGAAAAALVLPGSSSADHVTISISVSARVASLSDTGAIVEVTWAIDCKGASSPQYYGDLSLVNESTGKGIYMGGTAGGSGVDRQPVQLLAVPQVLKPHIRASCASYPDLHGSEWLEVLGNEVVVPALVRRRPPRDRGGGGGGGGGGNPPKKKPAPKKPGKKKTDPCEGKSKPPKEEPGTRHELSRRGLDQIKREEGWVPKLYNDQLGHCTIGYGHLVHRGNCDGSEPAGFRDGITKDEGEALLKRDVAEFVDLVNDAVTVPLTQNQFDALVDFAFNVGQGGKKGGFLNSSLLKALNCGVYGQVPRELLRWIYGHTPDGKTVEVDVLKKRRGREATTWLDEGTGPSTG